MAQTEKELCEICEESHNNYYLCDSCQIDRTESIREITLKDALMEFKGKSRKFKKYLKIDYESIKEEYPSESFGDEEFFDFIENTINATYGLDD